MSVDQHANETLRRILRNDHPLTEDAMFLALHNVLRSNNQSTVFQNVRHSKIVGGYGHFSFSPDIDLLEIRGSAVVGYELKGFRKAGRGMKHPVFYEGIDQALAMLKNPVRSPLSTSFDGSVFNYVYLAHPEGSGIEQLTDLLERFTPLGLIMVNRTGTVEAVKPKPNPYFDQRMQTHFLSRLDSLQAYSEFKVNPVQ